MTGTNHTTFSSHGKKVDEEIQKKNEWIELFDLWYVKSLIMGIVTKVGILMFYTFQSIVLRALASQHSCSTHISNFLE